MYKTLLLLSVCFVPALIFGQTNTGDCEGAIVLCGDLYTEESAPPGFGNTFEYTGICNQNNETMSLWYTFTVQQDGDLSFILTPSSAQDDYDWGLFDITTGGCAGISADGPSPEVSCNSWGSLSGANGATGISSAQGGTGNSNGPGDTNGPPFNADLPVTTGQTLALVVMNWSNSQDGYTIDFSGSTATIYDDINPTLTAASVNCGNSDFHVTFSEAIINSTAENFDFQITGPGGSYVFQDVNPDDPGATMDNGFTLTLGESITVPGTYNIFVTDTTGYVEDACGNLAIDATIAIELFAPITFETSVTTACNGEGGSITIGEISGGEEPYALTIDGEVESDFSATNLEDGTYTVVLEDGNQCIITSQIAVPDNPISVTIPEQDTLSCARPLVDITGVQVIPEQNVSYEWFYLDEDVFDPTGSNSSTPSFGAPGIYLVTVTNTSNGCTADGQVTLVTGEIESIDLSKMRFPNVITPNNDSKNEDWSPFIVGDENLNLASVFETFDLKVFNRWGQVVFSSDDGNGRRWTIGEEEPGTYYYILHYKITCGGVQEGSREGVIQLLK